LLVVVAVAARQLLVVPGEEADLFMLQKLPLIQAQHIQ